MSEGTGMDTISDDEPEVTLGVDTHLDQHAAAALDAVGRLLGTISVPATAAGNRAAADLGERLRPGHARGC
jgi:hypothetical protein